MYYRNVMKLNPDTIQRAPFWPELLAIKDTLSFAELGERFGAPGWVIRNAFERAGVTKEAMPRGPRANRKAEADTPGPTDTSDPLATLAGKLPDAEVAERAELALGAREGESWSIAAMRMLARRWGSRAASDRVSTHRGRRP